MPYTPAQIRLFRAAAHDPSIAASHGMSMNRARTMSMEGVKMAGGGMAQTPNAAQQQAVQQQVSDPNAVSDPTKQYEGSKLAQLAQQLLQRVYMERMAESGEPQGYAGGGRFLGEAVERAASMAKRSAGRDVNMLGERAPLNPSGNTPESSDWILGISKRDRDNMKAFDDERWRIFNEKRGYAGGGRIVSGMYEALRGKPKLRFDSTNNLRSYLNTGDETYGRAMPHQRIPMGHPDETMPRHMIDNADIDPPERFAEGGSTLDRWGIPAALGAAGMGIAGLAARRPDMINKAVRPLQRAMTRPVSGFESVAGPETKALSDARARLALESVGNRSPIHAGRGVWQGDAGTEFNPLYMKEYERTMGALKDHPALREVGQLGENLDQQAVPISRIMPQLINDPRGADALMMKGLTSEELKRLSALPDTAIADRPGGKTAAFNYANSMPVEQLMAQIRAMLPHVKPRYAASDRLLLGKEKIPGYTDMSYAEAGAHTPSQSLRNRMQQLMPTRDPEIVGGGDIN